MICERAGYSAGGSYVEARSENPCEATGSSLVTKTYAYRLDIDTVAEFSSGEWISKAKVSATCQRSTGGAAPSLSPKLGYLFSRGAERPAGVRPSGAELR